MTADQNTRIETPPQSRCKRKITVAILLLLALATLIGWKLYFPTHPKFGAIYETTAYDLNEARANRLGIFLRKHLPYKIIQSPHFPEAFKDQPRYLLVGGQRMEWSIGGTNTGWLYFWGINATRGNVPGKWEFAPAPETNFMTVVDAPAKFYSTVDPRREQVFGDSSTTNAIKVTAGQILFARRTDATNRIYVIQLKEQNQNKLVVHYCVLNHK